MLKGFYHPLTPKRQSALNPCRPRSYSSDFLNVECWANPSVVAATLPPELASDPSAEGHVNARFYDWQFSGENEEFLDPASVCGWTQGHPKGLGSVFQARYYPATGKAGLGVAAGSKFAATVSAGGQRLAEGAVTLREAVTDSSVLHRRRVVNLLHAPRVAAGIRDNPAVHELVENVPRDVKIEQVWIGDGVLELATYKGEDLSDLAPRRCGAGVRASMAYVVDNLKTLKQRKS